MTREFRIPLANQRQIFGVFLAAHAIPDAVDIMHTAVGCKPKAQRQISLHDRMREAQNKMVWSDVSDAHLITGSEAQLRDMTVETVRRRGNVGIVFITTSTAMEMTGIDVQALVPEISRLAGRPVVYIPTPGFEGDDHLGYARAIRAVMELCPWEERGDPGTVGLVGYRFDRYEHDHPMNLREVERMLAGVGLRTGVTFLSGRPLAGLMEAPRAGASLLLPWAASLDGWVEGATGRPCAPVPLPIGQADSEAFLAGAARAAGKGGEVVREAAARERERIAPLLEVARERIEGARVAVLADTPTARGILGFLDDVGMRPCLVGLLDSSLGGRVALGGDPGVPVLEHPSAEDVEEAWTAPDILVSPDVWLPPAIVEGVPRVEIGFPSNRRHAIHGQPVMGFRGCVALAQRFMDALAGVH